MGFQQGFLAGMVMHGQGKTNRLLEEQNELLRMNYRDQLIEELREEGMLLPTYDWHNAEFKKEVRKITDAFYARHPDMKKGDGQFSIRYPEKKAALDMLRKMAGRGRIRPDEYLAIYASILDF